MPFRHIPPEWLDYLIGLIAFVWASSIGAAASIANEVKMGKRKKFFSLELLLVVPSVLMSGMLAYGIASFYSLPLIPAMALGNIAGYAGTRLADMILNKIDRHLK